MILSTHIVLRGAMAKKSKRTKANRQGGASGQRQRVDALLALAQKQMIQGQYPEAIETSRRALASLPQRIPLRADALASLGIANMMLQNYEESYDALTEALTITQNDADLWFNRGMASRLTMRSGQSLRDFERAAELAGNSDIAKQVAGELKFSRKFAESSLKLRGRDFTLDQLIEQEDLFQRAVDMMSVSHWEEAEAAFRRVIAMGDGPPQPWGNLGNCLIMQERYDEAEEALKRAIALDRHYEIAKRNLAALPEIRRKGPPKLFGISHPLKGPGMKNSITLHTQPR